MKTNEEILRDFQEVADELHCKSFLVRIRLLTGLEPVFRAEERRIEIRPADRIYFGMPKYMLEGWFFDLSYGGKIIFDIKRDYRFSIRPDQIEDYEISRQSRFFEVLHGELSDGSGVART